MKLVVCSVFDRAVAAYGRPMFFAAVGAGIRAFQDEVNNPEEGSVINKHPEDYQLFHVGFFDDSLGRFSPCDGELPVLLVSGVDVRTKLRSVAG